MRGSTYVGGAGAALLTVVAAAAQEAAAPVQPPAPAAQREELRALVIEVKGRAQWRLSDQEAWRDAKVNDVLSAGVEVRTGLRSSLALRVGRNATVLVDRSTRLVLPVISQEEQTLQTRVGLYRGRADFKVDVVGLTNDFEVMTPTTTLSVRGTGFSVEWGGLEGTEIDALSADTFAVEVRYLQAQVQYLLQSGSVTTEAHPDPAVQALFDTFQTPLPSLTKEEYLTQMIDDAYLQAPGNRGFRQIEQGLGGVDTVERIIETLSPEVQLICSNVNEFFGAYMASLGNELGFQGFSQIAAFFEMSADVAAFCEELGSFQGDPLQSILDRVSAFCETYNNRLDAQRCESLFHDLLKSGPP